jgi:translation initiation factor 2 subunit 2
MADEPLFDPSLKKRKKKTVAFTEDPLGLDAAPTAPPPVIVESTTVDGNPVDLGPATTHEAMKSGGGEKKKDEEDEFKAMFGDLKKKKKKKEIPLDFVHAISHRDLKCITKILYNLG